MAKTEKTLEEQDQVLENKKKNLLVSASAGSGKTYVMIKYICKLVVDDHVPLSNFLVLTFTKSAAAQMKEKLLGRLKEAAKKAKKEDVEYIVDQIDSVSTSNICTIDSFCERTIKKHASVLGTNESFSVLDEEESKNLKSFSFQSALKNLAENKPDEFELVMSAYKNDQESIWKIVKTFEEISNAVANRDAFLQKAGENFEKKFDFAAKFLFEDFMTAAKTTFDQIDALDLEKFYNDMQKTLEQALASKDLFELFSSLQNIKKLPNRPSQNLIGQEVFERLQEIKDVLWEKVKQIKGLNLFDESNVLAQRSGQLEKAVLELFKEYENRYNSLKKAQNCKDFADLEKNMVALSVNENLFSGLKYVFVDEYQDTNKMQEEILKNVAKNCNFVAVGDLKQGIYGFRMASSEIFLNDMKMFEKDDNSDVKFLKSNFRSSQKVLDFVNDVFKVCMTEDVANVDYLSTSMLKSENDFVEEGAKAVNIDLVEKDSPQYDEIPKLYSVGDAKLSYGNSNETMLKDILRRINEVVGSKISDNGQLRQANYGDIAILARKRDGFFEQLEEFLEKNNIPIMSNSRAKLAKEPEIKMLINYLRLSLAIDDDVALLSVLLSGLYLLDVQKIFDEKMESGKGLVELVNENKSGYYTKFLQDLQEFRINCAIFGVKNAFLKLFSKTNYFSYINLRKDNVKIRMFVDKFLEEVEKKNFDIPSLVHYFDTVEIVVTPEASAFGDCVTLTTIHDSKGLEYPIVFLIECDKSIIGSQSEAVQINEKFGLALQVFDLEKNKALPSVRLLAIKEDERQKDFVEELMIFYVALTRAKNRLYLFGNFNEKILNRHDVTSCESYFDLIFFALKKARKAFGLKREFESENLSINYVESVEQVPETIEQNFEKAEFDEKNIEKIENYLDFSYKFNENKNFRLKESVTSLSKKFDEEKLESFSNDNFSFGGKAVEMGNAYHLALKMLDFDKIFDRDSLKTELDKFADQIDLSLIDLDILLKNVLILKNLTSGAKIFKEKEFVLKSELGLLTGDDVDDEILVQGIVDLFAVKDGKVVLVDYKYSSKNSDDYLKKTYKNQLKLYKIAIEKAFNMPVSECFLLSLKFAKIIPISV